MSSGRCLCTLSRRKRLDLPSVLQSLADLLAATSTAEPPAAAAPQPREAYRPSAPSLLVREIGSAVGADDEAVRRLQRNASNAFDALMRRLDTLHVARAVDAPTDFRERLDFWLKACALPQPLHQRMQRLRVWRNASEHHDSQRWRLEGPKSADDFEKLVKAVRDHLEKMEAT